MGAAMRFNPFRPGSVVGPGMFSGRYEELETLEKVLFQTKHGNPQHFLVVGERGIGKSSLLLFLQMLAKGQVSFKQTERFNFLVVNIELDPSTGYADIIKKIGAELERVAASQQRVKELAKSVWTFLSRWEVFGVKYKTQETLRETGPHELLEDLTYTVERLLSAIQPEFDGILFLIDEADKPPASTHLGEFVKLFTERLTKRGCENVAVGLAGLPTVMRKLTESHPSSMRVLRMLHLEPLTPSERIDVVRKGLVQANEKNGFEVNITELAESIISTFSEGYPHFIQQFSFSAFEADTNNEIDDNDVLDGAFNENGGAFQQLGLRYFEDIYFEKIWSDEYRDVLRAMAEASGDWISKATIRENTKLRETTLGNALSALKKRNIIIPKKGKKGIYRLPSRSFAVWIRAFTTGAPSVKNTDDAAAGQSSDAEGRGT
jgi:energy-coupling factor transporter ATP-binding protein EcfA2